MHIVWNLTHLNLIFPKPVKECKDILSYIYLHLSMLNNSRPFNESVKRYIKFHILKKTPLMLKKDTNKHFAILIKTIRIAIGISRLAIGAKMQVIACLFKVGLSSGFLTLPFSLILVLLKVQLTCHVEIV